MNNFRADELLRAFPYELSRLPGAMPDEQPPLETVDDYKDPTKASHVAMIAALVAEELEELSADHDLLTLYGRIDELDGPMLDILAWDYKIDWWDADAPLDKKREVFKSHFIVHRTLGSVGAVETAITSRYEGARVTEWPEYGGQPYHYRLDVDLGENFGAGELLGDLLRRARFYLNVRSVLDGVKCSTTRKKEVFSGLALLYGYQGRLLAEEPQGEFIILTDEEGVYLTDEDDDLLLDDWGMLFPLRVWEEIFPAPGICVGTVMAMSPDWTVQQVMAGCALLWGTAATIDASTAAAE